MKWSPASQNAFSRSFPWFSPEYMFMYLNDEYPGEV